MFVYFFMNIKAKYYGTISSWVNRIQNWLLIIFLQKKVSTGALFKRLSFEHRLRFSKNFASTKKIFAITFICVKCNSTKFVGHFGAILTLLKQYNLIFILFLIIEKRSRLPIIWYALHFNIMLGGWENVKLLKMTDKKSILSRQFF